MKSPGISLDQERDWLGATARRVQGILRRTTAEYLIMVPVETDSDAGTTWTQFAHSVADTAVVLQLFLDASHISSAPGLSYWVSAPTHGTVQALASKTDGVFPCCYIDRHLDDRARPPHDAPVLDLRSRGYSHFGVSLGYAPRFDRPATRLVVTDIAYFFHQCAKLLAGATAKLPREYTTGLPFQLLHPPSPAAIISEYLCPECSARRKSYERDCLECGWGGTTGVRYGQRVSPYDFEIADT